jgi:UDP-3-O-[3-hydroxymyristoyl] N-acetylglucosamine deacetylase
MIEPHRMRILGERRERTLAQPTTITGRGLVSGQPVTVELRPATLGGLVFIRTDGPAGATPIPANVDAVTDTRRRTTLGHAGHAGRGVTLVEHLLAALAGLRIDHCEIRIDAPEPPGLDGSAAGFVAAIRAAGAKLLPTTRPIVTPTRPVRVADAGATLALFPTTEPRLRISYVLDHGPVSPIARQAVTFEITPAVFEQQLAACRTFALESEARQLRAAGVGQHLSAADLLVFGPRGLVDNTLRYADEPARHKVLDLVGDLALANCTLAGHIVAYRSGHALNVALAQALVAPGADVARPPRLAAHPVAA